MKSIDDCILRVIIGLSRYFGNFYCFPAQQTIIRKIYEYDGVLISSATLNRHLDVLEADGFFTRVRRYDQRTREFRSTLYKLGTRSFYYLKRLGSFLKSVGGNVFDFLSAAKRKARSFNQASDALASESPPASWEENLVKWKALRVSLG